MPIRNLRLAFVIFALSALSGQSGSIAPGAGSTVDVKALVSDLGSDTFVTRERAQKLLLAMPLRQLDELRQCVTATTDPEASLRLHAVLDTLEMIEATTTPAVSLDIRDATYSEMAAALAKAAGTPIEGDAAGSMDRFTLNVSERPFWEVIDQLSNQHPLGLAERDGLTIRPRREPSDRRRQYTRGVLVSVTEPRAEAPRARVFANGRGAAFGGWITGNIVVAIDPRIELYQAHPPILQAVQDSLGHDIAVGADEDAQAKSIFDTTFHMWDRDIALQAPAKLGDKITLRGSVSFTVIRSQRSVEFSDPLKHLNEPVEAGPFTVTLRQVVSSAPADAPGNAGLRALGLKFEVTRKEAAGKPPEVGDMTVVERFVRVPSFGRRSSFPVRGTASGDVGLNNNDATITDGFVQYDAPENGAQRPTMLELVAVDAAGKELFTTRTTVATASTIVRGTGGEFADPAKLILKFGVVRDVTVPFEFKDLPVKR